MNRINKLFSICVLLFPIYSFYAFFSTDYRVSDNLSFILLIFIIVCNIAIAWDKLRSINSRFVFFWSMVFFWSVAFYVNSFKLLNLQIEWPSNTLALMIYILPIVAFLPSVFFTYQKNYTNRLNILSLKKINILIFISGMLLAIYEFKVSGVIPILMPDITNSRLEFGLPTIHVIVECFIKLSFYLSAYLIFIEKKHERIEKIIITICVLYYLVIFSRSGLMQFGFFIIILLALDKGQSYLTFTKGKIIFFFFLILSFSFLGAIRQGGDFDINNYTASKINNSAINWLYGYYFVNMDNLALSMSVDPVEYENKRSLIFLSQIFGTKVSQAEINTYSYIGKLNLGTGFRDFTLDWGPYIGTIVLSLIVLFYSFLYKLVKSKLFVLYKSLFITYIALFPMTNRFSGFIPFFIFLFIVTIDFFLRKRSLND